VKKRTVVIALLGGLVLAALGAPAVVVWLSDRAEPGVIDVHPGDDVQAALEEAAKRPVKPVVRLHPGTYRPSAHDEALIHFNARHDGVVLEGVGDVTLTAANPDVADPRAEGYPAVVNRVVFFGDGVSERTVLRNVRITGANGYVKVPPGFVPLRGPDDLPRSAQFLAQESSIEPDRSIPKTHYFYTDGGAILAYGRSYPTIENVEVVGNTSSVCAGGVSVQHYIVPFGGAVRLRNCTFRDNHAGTSGSAVDVLTPGSWVIIENCLFVGNVSDERVVLPQNTRFGALSVFPACRANVRNCTFTDNCSGADDRGESTYEKCVFWNNARPGGKSHKPTFELNVTSAAGVTDCLIDGRDGADLKSNVSRSANRFGAPGPEFDAEFRPRNPAYQGVGFRPWR
jgi:hypothetical protein